MVRAYIPQSSGGSIVANTIHTPQGTILDPMIIQEDPILAIYPPLGDIDYSRYKFYQVNKGEFTEAQTDFIWEITDSVGPGVFQEASGFDIRPFLSNERDLTQARDTGNSFAPLTNTQVMQMSDDQLHLFIWALGGVIQEWVLSAPAVFPPDGTSPDFTFSTTETNGRDIKFLKNGTEMAIVGAVNETVEIYSLPTPNSLSTTPILLQSFSTTFAFSDAGSCEFSLDEMKLYVVSISTDTVNQWNLTSPRVLPTAGTPVDRVFPYNPTVSLSNGNVRMLKDGTAFYLVSTTPDQINKYVNTNGANQIPITNKSPDTIFNLVGFGGDAVGMSISQDESFLWFMDNFNDTVNELFLPGLLLEYEVVSVNVSTGDFTIKVKVPSIVDFTFIQIAFGNAAATDGSTTLVTDSTLSTFETPLLTKDEDNFLVDDQGRNIVAVGQ